MLLIDGVRYHEWTDLKETEDLEPMVIKHAKDIFGEKTEYFNIKPQLEACLGRRTIPDGYVIDFGEPPQWHIVEVELSSHPIDKHIREQVNDFITAMEKVVSANRRKIIDEIYVSIRNNQLLRYRIEKLIEPKEIYEFLTNLILQKPPTLTIVIERKTDALSEELRASLRYSPMNIVELRTFRREGAESVHVVLIDPTLGRGTAIIKEEERKTTRPEVSSRNQSYQRFFTELVEQYSRRDSSWHSIKALPQNWLEFGAGKSGLWFVWLFRDKKRFAVELYIDTGNKAKNKQYFDKIKGHEAQLGIANISWERLDERRAARVAIYTNGDIQEVMSNKTEKERLIQWAIETMKNFSDNVKGVVKTL